MTSIKESMRGLCGDGFTTFTRQQIDDHEAYIKKMRAAAAENCCPVIKKDPEQFLLATEEEGDNVSAEVWKILMEHMKRINKIEEDLIMHVKNLEKEVTDLKNKIYILEKQKQSWGEWFTGLWKTVRNKFSPKKETILERLIREDKQN